MSTVVASHSGDSQPIDTQTTLDGDSIGYKSESEHAMLRARQRASMFVCQTAPQSVASSAATSPASKQPTKILWKNEDCPRVKSSLKLRPGLQRSNSEPSQKSVHFSTTNLVNVRQFRGTQKPSAVGRTHKMYSSVSYHRGDGTIMLDEDALSHGDSEDDDEDAEEDEDVDDYSDSGESTDSSNDSPMWSRFKVRTVGAPKRNPQKSLEWTLLTPGFVPHAFSRLQGPQRPVCYVETLNLSAPPTSLNAAVYVRNLAFHKYVALRYTIDGWASFSETKGVYSSDVRKFDRDAGFDRFDVSIPLTAFSSSGLNNLALKFCVHYVANDAEFWDNNGGKNYEVYLRNPLLASKPQAETKGHAMQKITEGLHTRRRHSNFEPRVIMTDEDLSDDMGHSGLSSSDFLRIAGIPLRTPQEVKLKDPFFNRYSFESAYSAKPKVPHEYPNAPVFAIKGDQVVAESVVYERSQPLRVSRGQSLKLVTAPSEVNIATKNGSRPEDTGIQNLKPEFSVQHEQHAPDAHAWESETYKDFVSKYCFYTPTHRAPHRAPSSGEQGKAPNRPPDCQDKPAKTEQLPDADRIVYTAAPHTIT